jgi:hypothetical protein
MDRARRTELPRVLRDVASTVVWTQGEVGADGVFLWCRAAVSVLMVRDVQ